jgi:Flp pilus assembly protein TadB
VPARPTDVSESQERGTNSPLSPLFLFLLLLLLELLLLLLTHTLFLLLSFFLLFGCLLLFWH